MNFGILEILTLIGSVGMFLYGMKLMSEGLQKAAGNKLRDILALMTNNKFIGALTGIFITALVQSSSATTTMIVSFVNAGLISLQQSMAVIFGANVGTTLTAWIISIFGFKVNISAFAIPLFAFGVPLLFMKKSVYANWGEFLIGFALLFLGLDYLNNSVPDLQANPAVFDTLRRWSDMGFGSVLVFALVGMLLTMIVQASSATFAIALIMCSKGWITFDLAAALVLGGNIGTCITPILASVSGNVMAKRAAAGHLMFNVLGSVWALALYGPYMKLISLITTGCAGDPNALYAFAATEDPATVMALNDGRLDTSVPENAALAASFWNMQYYVSFGLSMFHTVFNLINICIMIWFTKFYVKAVTFLIPSRKKNETQTEDDGRPHLEFISGGLMSTSELSILQAHKEIVLMSDRTYRMHEMIGKMFSETDKDEFMSLFLRVQKYENISDNMEVEIAAYLSKVADGRLSDESKHSIQAKLREISEIESIGDSYYNMARILLRRNENRIVFTQSMNEGFAAMFDLVRTAFDRMAAILKDNGQHIGDLKMTLNTEQDINSMRNELKERNIIDLNDGKYEYATGSVYMDLIVECEKIGDYIVNVVEALVNLKPGKGTSGIE